MLAWLPNLDLAGGEVRIRRITIPVSGDDPVKIRRALLMLRELIHEFDTRLKALE